MVGKVGAQPHASRRIVKPGPMPKKGRITPGGRFVRQPATAVSPTCRWVRQKRKSSAFCGPIVRSTQISFADSGAKRGRTGSVTQGGRVMRRIALVASQQSHAVRAVPPPTWSPHPDSPMADAAPIYGVRIPDGYRDWRLISVKRLTGKQLTGAGGELKQLRAELGNDLAIKAYRDGTLPFPDGAIIAALHWNENSSDFGQPSLGRRFSRRGPPIVLCRVCR